MTILKAGKLTKPHFENKESYQHLYAKELLKKWIENNNSLVGLDIVKVVLERDFCMNCKVVFVPDLTIYDKDGVKMFIEVVKSNPISAGKLIKMIDFFMAHSWKCDILEIKADWIMNQTKEPIQLKIERRFNP